MRITDTQDGGEIIYVVVDGDDYELSAYQGGDGLACLNCGQSEEWQPEVGGESECVRSLYTSLDDMYLCSDCIDSAARQASVLS